eukprot:scaffold21266_cov111-Isochrysis_galbana.AAC.2
MADDGRDVQEDDAARPATDARAAEADGQAPDAAACSLGHDPAAGAGAAAGEAEEADSAAPATPFSWTPNVNATEFVPTFGLAAGSNSVAGVYPHAASDSLCYWLPPRVPVPPADALRPSGGGGAAAAGATAAAAADSAPPSPGRFALSATADPWVGASCCGGADLFGVQGTNGGFDTAGEGAEAGPTFVAKDQFGGAWPGWVYKTGEQGLGYYSEPPKPRQRKGKNKGKGAAAEAGADGE